MKTKITCSCMAILFVLSIPAFAADKVKVPAAGQRVALFDGKTLDGWDILKCEAVVEDGCIRLKAGNGVVQTKKKYNSDFVIEFEWKALREDRWDSGVFFRYESAPESRPWPSRYEVNVRKGDEGNVAGLNGAKCQGLFKKGEWNTFKLTARGTTAELEINGKPAWKVDGLAGPKEGFIGLQAEVPSGGQCLFRNIYITELK
ncbi:MAG: DUF1080 domain-containing protein [Kiritimatiellae bacterium]|nr:DUF1080 domain-containing protein [Kiritimatiellia bacterium]MDD5522373.1 DUF1080 domain-containing protein [Kiritimatiellia bacterium]